MKVLLLHVSLSFSNIEYRTKGIRHDFIAAILVENNMPRLLPVRHFILCGTVLHLLLKTEPVRN
jgi:hypothetical protein